VCKYKGAEMLKKYKVCGGGLGHRHNVDSDTVGYKKPLATHIEGVAKAITDKAYCVIVHENINTVEYFVKNDAKSYCADMI
jgi:hypothetical protein